MPLSTGESCKLEDLISSVSGFYSRMKSLNKKYKIRKISALKRQHDNFDDSDVSGNEMISETPPSKRPRAKRITKSRNSVINEWLAIETSNDNYADLEDFIVP